MTELQNWLVAGGAKLSSLEVVNFGAGYRGVVSMKPIQKRERLVFIPKTHLITLEKAKESPICSELLARKVELLSPKHTILAIFLL
jgi:protein-histidine N-methyltransferase